MRILNEHQYAEVLDKIETYYDIAEEVELTDDEMERLHELIDAAEEYEDSVANEWMHHLGEEDDDKFHGEDTDE